MSERLALRYGKYWLVTERLGDGWTARAHLGGRVLHECRAGTVEAALAEGRWWLDEHERELRAQRRDGIPTVEEYRRALVLVPMGTHHEAMLRAHAEARDRMVTATELAAAAGHDDAAAALRDYSRLGRMVAEFIGFTPPRPRQHGQPLWTAAIAVSRRRGDGVPVWMMFPELAAAMMALEPV